MARLCEYKGIRGEPIAGIFHRWGDDFTYGPGDEKIPKTIAVVEDLKTGKVANVEPGDLTFIKTPNPLSPDLTERDQKLLERLAESQR